MENSHLNLDFWLPLKNLMFCDSAFISTQQHSVRIEWHLQLAKSTQVFPSLTSAGIRV